MCTLGPVLGTMFPMFPFDQMCSLTLSPMFTLGQVCPVENSHQITLFTNKCLIIGSIGPHKRGSLDMSNRHSKSWLSWLTKSAAEITIIRSRTRTTEVVQKEIAKIE